MTHRLTSIYAKNYCNRTLIVKVIIENVVTCFFGTQCISHDRDRCFHWLKVPERIQFKLATIVYRSLATWLQIYAVCLMYNYNSEIV